MFAISFVIPCYNAETFILKNLSASSENMILSSDEKSFYNLSFAENIMNSEIQLKKVEIEDGSTTLLGDKVPFKTNKFPNEIDLFQFKNNNGLILFKKEYLDNKIQKKIKREQVKKKTIKYLSINKILPWSKIQFFNLDILLKIEGGD